jgi:hypothetical protein
MRTIVAVIALTMLAACQFSSTDVATGTAGEAFGQIQDVRHIHVLAVNLPDEFHGDFSADEEKRYRYDWPMAGARLIADGVSERCRPERTAVAALKKPDVGYYFELDIIYLDLGDRHAQGEGLVGGGKEGWSLVLATGRIINAETDELIVELNFSQSSGKFRPPFESDMAAIGEELGDWLNDQR